MSFLGWMALAGGVMLLMALSSAADVAGLTISVVALSILIHGISASPVLARYERSLSR